MSARVSTLSYFLQGIIEIRCFKIRDGARMVLFDRDGGGIPVRLGWYEFIWKTNTWSGSYMNSHTQRGGDKSGLGRVVESIPFSERRIHPGGLEVVLSIARANIPPAHPQLGWQNS